ncbi:hypothetical protein THAOC_24536, partial [Thalassiosira oceanica]
MEFRCDEEMYIAIDQQQGSENMETCCSREYPCTHVSPPKQPSGIDDHCLGNLVCGDPGSCSWGPQGQYQCCVEPATMFQDISSQISGIGRDIVSGIGQIFGGRRELHSTPPVGTFYTEHGGGTYEWSYESKCIPGHNIDNIHDITYEDCARRCLACKDDSRCNASMGPCVGIEWLTAGSHKGRCTLSSAASGPPCDNSVYGVQFYSFKELPPGRHGRALTEESNPDTKICVFAQNPSAVRSTILSQGGWVHHDLYEELGTAGFTVAKEEQGLTSTISMDIMCTESDHVTLPAMTPSGEVYGLCTSASASSSGLDSTICVMTVDYRNYPDQEAIVASWRQSLEADGFIRLEDIGDEEELSSLLCLWPNWEDQDYYCHYRLSMHCKHNAVSATLPPAPNRTLSMGVCAYGSDVQTALATVGGDSFPQIPSSDINGHQEFWSVNRYWDLVGFENTPCNNGGIFLQAPAILELGDVVSVAVNPVDSTICVMSFDRPSIPQIGSWQESLESEEYGFIRLELSQDLYMRINAGDSVGAIYNLLMHCKYYAARATLPPVPQDITNLGMGVCAYGNDVHTAAGAIEGNSFTPVASSDIDGHELFYSDNPYWDLHGFEGTPCSDGGVFLQAPTLLGSGAVASVAVNPVDNPLDAPPLAYTALSVAHLNEAQPIVWDDTRDGDIYRIGGFHGVCVFIAGHQR